MMLQFLIPSSGRRLGVLRFLVLCATASALLPSTSHAQNASFQGLGFLPIADIGSHSQTLGVSSDATTAVGQSSSSLLGLEAFRWFNGTRQGLGFLPDFAASSAAAATNSDGTIVVGTAKNANGRSQAFRWVN